MIARASTRDSWPRKSRSASTRIDAQVVRCKNLSSGGPRFGSVAGTAATAGVPLRAAAAARPPVAGVSNGSADSNHVGEKSREVASKIRES
eukprot:CAMPEP_0195654252 /NCGR_PEP_ID=MMETSP0815-20121206/33820_1 /TAXON_ID=97485 /ORGANISM="Prymnesium parvum, Strain Texoma1" /LENGTH=90 /DNA_ID=CAMNT_0040798449 /DNA_START=569 /DNA_END=841 /DNA_ORIENTATION=+